MINRYNPWDSPLDLRSTALPFVLTLACSLDGVLAQAPAGPTSGGGDGGGGGGGGGGSPITIIVSVAIVGSIGLVVLGIVLFRSWDRIGKFFKRWGNDPSTSTSTTSGTTTTRQVSGAPVTLTAANLGSGQRGAATTTGNGNNRTRGARRTDSTSSRRTVPIYSEDPADEEMTLVKVEDGAIMGEGTAFLSSLSRIVSETASSIRHSMDSTMTQSQQGSLEGGPMSDDSHRPLAPHNTDSDRNPHRPSSPPPNYGDGDDVGSGGGGAMSTRSRGDSTASNNSGMVGARSMDSSRNDSSIFSGDSASTHQRSRSEANALNPLRPVASRATSNTSGRPRAATGSSSIRDFFYGRLGAGAASSSTSLLPMHQVSSNPSTPGINPSNNSSSTLSLWNPLRSTSAVNLTSPSTTSLTSGAPISSPIPETMVHLTSDFKYPKKGMTQEQMKFITSKENLSKWGFGTPWEELGTPPAFEEGGAGEERIADASGSGTVTSPTVVVQAATSIPSSSEAAADSVPQDGPDPSPSSSSSPSLAPSPSPTSLNIDVRNSPDSSSILQGEDVPVSPSSPAGAASSSTVARAPSLQGIVTGTDRGERVVVESLGRSGSRRSVSVSGSGLPPPPESPNPVRSGIDAASAGTGTGTEAGRGAAAGEGDDGAGPEQS